MTRIVAYRKGSLDAFIAAFIYWKLFKSALSQKYAAVDPFDGNFVADITRTNNLEWLVSIGANIKGEGTTRSEHGFIQSKEVPPDTLFFSYEVNDSFPSIETFDRWTYVKDEKLSLTQLMLKVLEREGYLDASSSDFRLMNQFFRFSSSPRFVIDADVAAELAVIMPNMLPEDFETLDNLLFSPSLFTMKMSRRNAMDTILEQHRRTLEHDRAKACITQFDRVESNAKLISINSANYNHPNAASDYRDTNAYVFVYEQLPDGVRGRLFAPVGGNALTFFPGGVRSGVESEADYFMPGLCFADSILHF